MNRLCFGVVDIEPEALLQRILEVLKVVIGYCPTPHPVDTEIAQINFLKTLAFMFGWGEKNNSFDKLNYCSNFLGQFE